MSYCEFLDTEWYTDSPIASWMQPWRRSRGETYTLQRDVIRSMAQRSRLREVSMDPARLDVLRSEILRDGLTTPLLIIFDPQGHVTLGDGHNRLLATEGLEEHVRLPVEFSWSEGIRAESIRLGDIFSDFIRELRPR